MAFVALQAYGAVAALAGVAWLTGRAVLARFPFRSDAEGLALRTTVGLGIVSHVLAIVGLLGRLDRAGLVASLGLLAVGAIAVGWSVPATSASPAARERRDWRHAAAWAVGAVGVLFLVRGVLLKPLLPAVEYDSTLYHLAIVRDWIREGAVAPAPFRRFPVGTHNLHTLFAGLLLVGDDRAAQVLSFLCSVLVGLLLWAAARRFAGPIAAWVAPALWAANLIVVERSVVATYHLLSTLMVIGGGLAFLAWTQSSAPRWLGLAGALLGLAAGTHHLALFYVLPLVVAVYIVGARERRARDLGLAAGAMALTGSFWYVRCAFYTGNPFWPFLGGWFGVGPWWSQEDAARVAGNLASLGVARTVGNLVRLPWLVTFQSHLFQAPSASVSPVLLYGAPVLAVAAWRDRVVRGLIVLLAAQALFWFATAQALRHLLPAIAVLALAYSIAADRLAALAPRPRLRRWATVALAVTVAVLVMRRLSMVSALTLAGGVPVTAAETDEYRARHVAGYRALRRAADQPGLVYGLGGPNLAYFSEHGFAGDVVGIARSSDMLERLVGGVCLDDGLRLVGARYLLVTAPHLISALPADRSFFARFRLIHSEPGVELFERLEAERDLRWPPRVALAEGFEGDAKGAWEREGSAVTESAPALVRSGDSSLRLVSGALAARTVELGSGEECWLRLYSRSRRRDRHIGLSLAGSTGPVIAPRRWPVPPRWSALTVHFVLPPDVHAARLVLEAVDGTVWVDDVWLACLAGERT
jgi:hypothetical protein